MTTKETIKSFLTEMATQSNRSTRGLYYYVIQDEETYRSPTDDCDYTEVYYDDRTYASEDDMIEKLTAYYKEDDYTDEEIKPILRTARHECCHYGVKTRYTYDRFFLTETEAKDHLACNKHHYTSKAQTYIKHAWRAPELNNFFKCLFEHFDIDSGKQDLWEKPKQNQPETELTQ